MAFARGKYGVEYTIQPTDEKSGGRRWIFVSLGILLVASFILARLFARKQPARIDADSRPTADSVIGTEPAVPAPPGAAASTPRALTPTAPPRNVQAQPDPQATRDAAKLRDTARQRPAAERVLLEKLAAAEKQGNVVAAIDTIKRLCGDPSAAGRYPHLWKRLGQLNMQLLLSERSSPWTARITVKKGDSRDLLARNSHTTGAALDRLNPNTNWTRIRPGDVVRVLQYPKAALVVHKEAGFADLSLKGGFFRRYVFDGRVRTAAGDYTVTREPGKTAHAILRDLGVEFTSADRADLEMFLAPESTVTVSDQ